MITHRRRTSLTYFFGLILTLHILFMVTVHQASFNQACRRYIDSLGAVLPATLGMNKSTHVAEVCLDPAKPNTAEVAVVKHFRYQDKGWANEYIAWTLAQNLGVHTPPRAALLIGHTSDIIPAHGQELATAAHHADAVFVLWCTSAIAPTQPLQQVYGRTWEQAVLRADTGRRLGSLDGWIANCDRISANALYWSAQGSLVAIDHEKLAFNKDWTTSNVEHDDEKFDKLGKPIEKTRLLAVLMAAKKSSDSQTKKNARTAASAMFEHSKTEHPTALAACRAEITSLVDNNFSTSASGNLLSFLDYRLAEDCLKKRFGLLT